MIASIINYREKTTKFPNFSLLWLGLNAFGEDGFEEFAQMTEGYPNIDLGDPESDLFFFKFVYSKF